MDKKSPLPFKVGDEAESKSFENGYRGAWFRCKIRVISEREGRIRRVSEYYDFPDEQLRWENLYQEPPHLKGREKEMDCELMLRPRYPPIYHKNQMPLVSDISEVSVIIDDDWRVGDLVDWWTTGCYWSGKIIELYGDDAAKIELKQPPDGEGCVDDILFKDIRPSLDWSPESGWTVPTKNDDSGRVCAWILKPLERGQAAECDQETDEPLSGELQKQSVGNISSEEMKDSQDASNNGMESPSEDDKEEQHSDSPQECMNFDAASLFSEPEDPLEEAVMDLEDLLTKIKFMMNVLKQGIPSSFSERPEWEIVDHQPTTSVPKHPK